MNSVDIDRFIKVLEEKIAREAEHQVETWDRGGVGVGYRLLAQGTWLEEKRETLALLKKFKQLCDERRAVLEKQQQVFSLISVLILNIRITIIEIRAKKRVAEFHPELLLQHPRAA